MLLEAHTWHSFVPADSATLGVVDKSNAWFYLVKLLTPHARQFLLEYRLENRCPK